MGPGVHQASYTLPGDIRATLVRTIAYMGGLAILALMAASFFQESRGSLVITPAPIPTWTTAEHPYAAFELRMPELSGSPYTYAILRRDTDKARKDVLTWGQPAAGEAAARPYAMVEIFRPGTRGETFLDAPSEVAARLIDDTIADDVKPIGAVDSKFGPMPMVDFAIEPQGHLRRCLGFARAFDNPAMQIAGWYCSAGAEVIDRSVLACMIDRLTVVNGDAPITAFFAHAEIKRTFCGQRSPILAATPEREAHIGPQQTSKLKSVLRGHLPAR
jgi:hypothetical protein